MKRFVLFFSMVFCLGLSIIVREEMAKEEQVKEEQKATPAVQATKKPVNKTNTEVGKVKQKQKKETHQSTLFEIFECNFVTGFLVVLVSKFFVWNRSL